VGCREQGQTDIGESKGLGGAWIKILCPTLDGPTLSSMKSRGWVSRAGGGLGGKGRGEQEPR
jgi:hypothetical protein